MIIFRLPKPQTYPIHLLIFLEITKIIFQSQMNHPSDYMPDYRDSQSSDSSNHYICPQNHTHHNSSHKNKSQISLIKPKQKGHPKQKNKKHSKSTLHKSPVKKKSKKQTQKHTKFDIFVYGGSFYSCGNVDEISNRFRQKQKPKQSQKVMLDYRLRRKEQKCIQKIQKYLKGFLQTKITKKQQIGTSQRLQLYTILKKQQQQHKEQNVIEQLLKRTLQTLEQKCENLILIYPTQREVINRWKNVKMHQLMTAQSFLLTENQLNLDIFDLSKEISLLKQEEFFPQMRQQAHKLQKQLITHLQSQQLRSTLKLQDKMVVWVLNRFLTFIQCILCKYEEREDIWYFIAQTLQQYQCGSKRNPLITNQIYVQFQKSQIGQDQSQEEDYSSKVYLHLFNKAVVDLINQVAFSLTDAFPAIQCIREIFRMAKTKLASEQLSVWFQDSLLAVDNLIFEQLLEDLLTEFLDFL